MASSTQYFQLSLKDVIEIDYFQSDRDKNFTTTTCPCCSSRLKVDQVRRALLFSSEDTRTLNEVLYEAPIREHCLPYVSNDRLCPYKLARFRVATGIPEQIMSPVMDDIWSFAQEVVPVVTKVRGMMVRPFTMTIKHVTIDYYERAARVPRSLPNDEEDVGTSEGYEFFEDCFEKVILNSDNIAGQSCSICFEDFATGMDLRRLPCSHIYHGDCIVKWLGTKPACPLCRFTIIE